MSNPTEPPRPGPRPVWPAALLAGLLAGAVAFALGRTFPAPVPAPRPSEARAVADALVAKLRAGQYDEFAALPHLGRPDEAEKKVAEVRDVIARSREYCATHFKSTSGEFELMRESSFGPSLAKLLYLERFPTGGVVWGLGLFRAADGWRVISVAIEPIEVAFPALR